MDFNSEAPALFSVLAGMPGIRKKVIVVKYSKRPRIKT